MIRGFCRTNIDDCKTEEWPTAFAFPPREGDWIQSKEGVVLKVCCVTHRQLFDGKFCTNENIKTGDPFIEVELTKAV